ncbi:DEAD/DEAH box helicase family protein, partial [Paracoccus binzhouensis]|uniref:hypothetical protein n=1 Tax=Paracoccus binzhouensis TaxID=2796149 RepID=UPI0018EF0022
MTYIADEHLALLKPFQKATVEYVFRRLFTDPSPTDQFLVADEVGLGKTMVARGVIAKTIEQLQGKVDRVDIVYICSNQAIAEQNIKSLNVVGSATKPLNTRCRVAFKSETRRFRHRVLPLIARFGCHGA